MTKITITYAPDTNFLPLTLVSMASVLKNARKEDEIEFVIMYASLNEKYLPLFNSLKNIKEYNVIFKKIDTEIFKSFPCPNWVTVETWFRCMLADLLPEHQKVLYLDCDTIVRKSLHELFEFDLGDNMVAVVEDISKSKQNAKRIDLKDNFYFNAGVIYINLEKWRKCDFFEKLKNIVLTDESISNDQDALNKATDGKKLRISPKYDLMHVWWRENISEYDNDYMQKFEEIKKDPTIVHFTGVKPNNDKCQNYFRPEFLEYSKDVPDYADIQAEIGIKKAGKGRTKIPFYKRIFSIETSTDKLHKYINILGLTLKFKIKKKI